VTRVVAAHTSERKASSADMLQEKKVLSKKSAEELSNPVGERESTLSEIS
jgi:hypothetical protein